MKRHRLLICGALILSLLALAYSFSVPVKTAVAATAPPSVTAVPLRRFYNALTDHHFYTIVKGTDGEPEGADWKEEQPMGFVFPTQVAGTVPLYILFRVHGMPYARVCGNDFFYTRDKSEALNAVANLGWASQGASAGENLGVEAYVSPTQLIGTVPLYRLYRPLNEEAAQYFAAGYPINSPEALAYAPSFPCGDDHFYTIDKAEMKFAADNYGYQLERTEAYVWTKPVTVDVNKQTKSPAPESPPESYYLEQLKNLNCVISKSDHIECNSTVSYFICEDLRKNGKISAKSCLGPNLDLEGFNKAEAKLVSLSCKRFLGRAGEYICETWAGGEACENYANQTGGPVSKCYTPQKNLVLSYRNSFGREPTAKEFAYWEQKMKAKNVPYKDLMKAHSEYIKTDNAEKERIALVNRNYFEVFGRVASVKELSYSTDKIAKEGTSYEALRKINIDWLYATAEKQELHDTIKRALLSVGVDASEPAITSWAQKLKGQKLTFQQIGAKVPHGFPKG